MSENVKKGIRLFLLISIVTSIVILMLTISSDTWNSLKKIQPLYLLLAFALLLIYYYLDGLRIKVLAKGLNYDISVMTGIDVVVSGIFLAAITPFQTGGLPVQVYCMKKKGIPYGEGTLILFVRGILAALFHVVALPFIFFTYKDLLANKIVIVLLKYLIIFYPLMIVLMLIAVIYPEKVITFLRFIDKKFNKNASQNKSKLAQVCGWLETEIKLFKDGLKYYFKKKKMILLLSLFLTFVAYVIFFSLAAVILYALLGKHIVNPLTLANLQFLHNFLVYFMPTPGASGIAETLFAILFKDLCPKELLGIYAIIWRFFTFNIGAAIGGFLTIKIMNQTGKTIDDIIKEEKETEV